MLSANDACSCSGFGLSDKALVSYEDYSVWQRQLTAFMTDVVKDKCVLVGNSLGGYTSLSAAAANPSQVAGVALLNGAGDKPADDICAHSTVLTHHLDNRITSISVSW